MATAVVCTAHMQQALSVLLIFGLPFGRPISQAEYIDFSVVGNMASAHLKSINLPQMNSTQLQVCHLRFM